MEARKSYASITKMIEAPNVYFAAVIMSKTPFYEGRGDRSRFFELILGYNPA